MNIAKANIITVFEHESLRTDKGEKRITLKHLEILRQFHGELGTPYFSLIHNGIKFTEYVGILQIGTLTIEVLPKADKSNDKEKWRNVLIGMLQTIRNIDVAASSNTQLTLKSNSILDLYFKLLLQEVEALVHRGLIKNYRKTQGNVKALVGSLQFPKHVIKNIVHQERFYVKHTTYDQEHTLNKIIFKTLVLIKHLNNNNELQSRISSLLLNFPEMPDINVSESTFDKIVFNRKSESYRTAIEIAHLLLLNYHPDIQSGRNNVLALMFDMNVLWERFIYQSIKKYCKDYEVKQQANKPYWQPKNGRVVKIRPDIILKKGNTVYVVDTKWKVLNNLRPTNDDLQQMYAYTKYFQSKHTILCYPGEENGLFKAFFYDEEEETARYKCSILKIGAGQNVTMKVWQQNIAVELISTLGVKDDINKPGYYIISEDEA